MRKWFWILLVLVAIAVIVVATLPARLITERVLPESGALQLSDVSGTIWSGRAGRVIYKSADQGSLDWRVKPLPLFTGRIDTDLVLQGVDLSGNARVLKKGDRVRLDDAHFSLPARRLEPLLDIPALQFTGTVDIDLDELEMQGRTPLALKGRATWRDAGVTGEEQASFGTLVARFGPLPGGGFGGEVNDEGGPLAVKGNFKTTLLGYEAHATLRARDGNPQVTRALRHIGQVQADGSVVFEVRGGLTGAPR